MAKLVYDENGRLLFTKEMKQEYTILMPQMLPIHFGMFRKLLELDHVTLNFENAALDAIAQKAIDRKIGARGLRAVMEGLLTKVMYDIPSDRTIDRVTITRDCVDGKEPPQLGHRKEALQEGKPAAELPPVEPAS